MSSQSRSSDQRVYRLALYGVRSSGKTCILSALSLPCDPHPSGYSCSWIEDVPRHALPAGDRDSRTTDDPFHVGWHWLAEQRSRLKAGELPPPNPNRDPMCFLFDFGSREYGVRRVELIDYSGELITASASELATTLRKHMRSCDGLLILAEVPYPGRDHAPLAEDLEKLKGAFSLLLKERDSRPHQTWPIALLFNKWDRRTIPDGDGDADSTDMVTAFLGQSPSPPHATLIDTVANAVGEQNLKCFPVSAFGSHEVRGDGQEVPRLDGPMLKSFGLEDGFIWVTDRCEVLRVEMLESSANAASWWAFPQLLLGRAPGHTAAERSAWKPGISPASGVCTAAMVCRDLKDGSPLHRRASRALRTFRRKIATQIACLILTASALSAGAETLWDGFKYRQLLALQGDPSATSERLQQGQAWLESYFASPSYRHVLSDRFILPRTEAHRLLVAIRDQRDEAMWKPVDGSADSRTKATLARDYIKEFPHGKFSPEARLIVAEDDRQKQQRKNLDYLQDLSTRIQAFPADAAASLDALHALNADVGTLPHPHASSEPIADRQQELRNLIEEKQTAILALQRQAEWDTFKANYNKLMQNKNVADAARELDLRMPKDDRLRELEEHFRTDAPQLIQAKVEEAIKNRAWQSARGSLRLSEDQHVAALLSPEDIVTIRKSGRTIDAAEDLDLYEQIVRNKPHCADQIRAYLSNAPLKAMEAHVREYQGYMNQLQNPLPLTLNLTEIAWHSDYWAYRVNYYNNVKVLVKGDPLITATGIRSKANTRSADIGNGSFESGLNDIITIDVSIVAKYGWVYTSSMSGGSGTWRGTPNQLRAGVTIDLPGKGFTNKATFSLLGVPAEPKLPAWRRK